jgi:hypothetical protein
MKKICPNCGADNPADFKYCTQCGHALPQTDTTQEASASAAIPERRTASAMPMGSGAVKAGPPPRSNAQRKSSKVWIIVGCIVAFLVLIVVGATILFKKVMNSDKVIEAYANQLNAKMPVMVDNDTRLDNVAALPGNVFQYNYTMINIDGSRVDTVKAKEIIEPQIESKLKTNDGLDIKIFRAHKTTLMYVYKDKAGQYVLSIIITADKYQ